MDKSNNSVFNPLAYSINFSYEKESSIEYLNEDFDFISSIYEKEIFLREMNFFNSSSGGFYIEFNKKIEINETIKDIILDSNFDQIIISENEIAIPYGLCFKFNLNNMLVSVNINSLGMGSITKEILQKILKNTIEYSNNFKDPYLFYFINNFNEEIDSLKLSNKEIINHILKFKEYYLERINFDFYFNIENYELRRMDKEQNIDKDKIINTSENNSKDLVDENTLINNISKLKIRLNTDTKSSKICSSNEEGKNNNIKENINNIESLDVYSYDNFIKLGGLKGDTITDRKSVFQAHAIKLNNPSHVKTLTSMLKENKKIGKATHNIIAYRINNKNYKDKHYDDDGENKAGERLLELLENMNVNNIYVMVSRWYGGIQLGADRFKHINDSAKNIINKNIDYFNN